MPFESPEFSRLNAAKSFALASALFPGEVWEAVESGVWAARTRLVERVKEPEKWGKEISQVRILTGWGSAAYFDSGRTEIPVR